MEPVLGVLWATGFLFALVAGNVAAVAAMIVAGLIGLAAAQ